ncbi:MAG: PEP/pyruvate-binding domain-containing protein, partial [Burkholderiaceae bacterium]
MQRGKYVIPFSQLRMSDVDSVGGKNASLGEMLSQLSAAGVRVPDGFATTAEAFREFLRHARLSERIADRLSQLNVEDVRALSVAGEEIRSWIVAAPFSEEFQDEIESIFQELISGSASEVSFAVRSSATAEDLPDASFAGQQETFLNV